MSIHLRIFLIIFALLLTLLVFKFINSRKLPIKYSLFWLFAAILILLVGLIPDFINVFTSFIGFQTTSNLVIGIILVIVLFITLLLTLIISEQKQRIVLLMQEVSLLKYEVEKRK